jgi:hypothetical protein
MVFETEMNACQQRKRKSKQKKARVLCTKREREVDAALALRKTGWCSSRIRLLRFFVVSFALYIYIYIFCR